MYVQARAVSPKHKTTGWKISNKWYTRSEAVRLAKSGKIDGVVVRKGGNDEQYIASHPDCNYPLYDLPTYIVSNGKLPRKHHA